MACAQPCSIVAVKIFIEQKQIAPVRVRLKNVRPAVNRTPPVFSSQKNTRQPPRNLRRRFPKRHLPPGKRRKFNRELLAVIKVIPLQRLDQQKVQWEPHWPSPVRISAK